MRLPENPQNQLESIQQRFNVDVDVYKSGGTDACRLKESSDDQLRRKEENPGGMQVVTISSMRSSDPGSAQFRDNEVDRVITDPTKRGKEDFNTTSHLLLSAHLLQDILKGDSEDSVVEASEFEPAKDFNRVEGVLCKTLDYLRWELKSRLEELDDPQDLNTSLEDYMTTEFAVLESKMKKAYEEGWEANVIGEDCIISNPKEGKEKEWFSPLRIGEDISAHISTCVAINRGMKAENVTITQEEAQDIIGDLEWEKLQDDFKSRELVFEKINSLLRSKVGSLDKDVDIVFVSGYVPLFAFERGYTDVTGMAVAVALKEEGRSPMVHKLGEDDLRMVSPHIDPTAKSVEECSYDVFSGIVSAHGANSPIISEAAVKMGRENNIPIGVYNPNNLNRVSVVSKAGSSEKGVQFIDMRDDTTVLTLTDQGTGGAMNLPGSGSKITNVLAELGLSYKDSAQEGDLMSFTFHQEITAKTELKIRDKIGEALQIPDGEFIFEKNDTLATIFCKGDSLDEPGVSAQILAIVGSLGISIELISQPSTYNSMSFTVPSNRAKEVVIALKEEIESRNPAEFLCDCMVNRVKTVIK